MDKLNLEEELGGSSPYLPMEDPSLYYETYMATPSFNDRGIVASNKDPAIAIAEARAKGFEHPVIIYCPDPSIIQIPSVFTDVSKDFLLKLKDEVNGNRCKHLDYCTLAQVEGEGCTRHRSCNAYKHFKKGENENG